MWTPLRLASEACEAIQEQVHDLDNSMQEETVYLPCNSITGDMSP